MCAVNMRETSSNYAKKKIRPDNIKRRRGHIAGWEDITEKRGMTVGACCPKLWKMKLNINYRIYDRNVRVHASAKNQLPWERGASGFRPKRGLVFLSFILSICFPIFPSFRTLCPGIITCRKKQTKNKTKKHNQPCESVSFSEGHNISISGFNE